MSPWEKIKRRFGWGTPPAEETRRDGTREAIQAKENAEVALREARQRSSAISNIAGELAELRARNHFGESVELAMMRRRT